MCLYEHFCFVFVIGLYLVPPLVINVQYQIQQERQKYSNCLQREYTELPERFVEVNSDADNRHDRKIVTLRRHVERVLPVSRHPDLQAEEYPEMRDNYVPHRLARNDSVDTMHKRPSSEQLETNYRVLDRGVQYYPDEHDGADARVRQVPSMSDMLICYPTQEGYYAWRNQDRGSWYVEALLQVFMKYAHCEDVCAMLNRVNLLVSKKVSHCPNADMDRMSQMSEYKSTLRMPHLFFFPGIGTA